jgi:elongator complex protein 5
MSLFREPRRRQQPFLLLQSSIAQSSVGIIRQLLADATGHALLFCLLHSSLLSLQAPHVQTYDLLDNIPGYNDNHIDTRQRIQAAVENGDSGSIS